MKYGFTKNEIAFSEYEILLYEFRNAGVGLTNYLIQITEYEIRKTNDELSVSKHK